MLCRFVGLSLTDCLIKFRRLSSVKKEKIFQATESAFVFRFRETEHAARRVGLQFMWAPALFCRVYPP